jgi:ABC-type amino acid transport substrate-binding protein
MKRLLSLLLFFILPLAYGQTLIIGTVPQNPPFSLFANKDHFIGFEIDLMGEICKRIQVNCRFVPLIFNDLFPQLKARKIDLAIAAIIITHARQQDFLFSLPYLVSSGQFLTLKQSSINKPQDIIHKRIGVRLGTPFKSLAMSLYNNQVDVTEYLSTPELLDALTDNKLDVILMNSAAAQYWFGNTNDTYKLIGAHLPTGDGYGIAANKDKTDLIDQINQALLSMQADGSYLQIYTRYFDN